MRYGRYTSSYGTYVRYAYKAQAGVLRTLVKLPWNSSQRSHVDARDAHRDHTHAGSLTHRGMGG